MNNLKILSLIMVLCFFVNIPNADNILLGSGVTEGVKPIQRTVNTMHAMDEGQVETGEIESVQVFVNDRSGFQFYTNEEDFAGAYPGDNITWFILWNVHGNPDDVVYDVLFQAVDPNQPGHVWAEFWDDKIGDGSQAHARLYLTMPDHDVWFHIEMYDSSMQLLDKSTVDIIPRRSLIEEIDEEKEDKAFDGYNILTVRERHKGFKILTLVVTDMEGEIIKEGDSFAFPQESWKIYGFTTQTAKFINSTTILYGADDKAVFWNIYSKKSVVVERDSHHEYEYNPLHNTIFTFEEYTVEIEGTKYIFDEIEEYDLEGNLVWSLDSRSFISHTQWCPGRDRSGDAAEITHSNSLFFDPDEDVFYYHPRNLNTFYKIDHKTGKVIWGLGEHGDFTMYDMQGNLKHNLFYHAHSVKMVDNNTFILFDNDKHNQTNNDNHQSRMLEITIDETTMTANESWAWIAPQEYYCASLGDADRLPNGNRLGTFGDALGVSRMIEVNEEGQIVWDMFCPHTQEFIYTIGRMERFRLRPILNSPPDIQATNKENVTVNWQAWYNFFAPRQMRGSYTLFLNGAPIATGSHLFDKYWRPTNLTFHLGSLLGETYNLTLALADEAGHISTDSLNITVSDYFIDREGPISIEIGQLNSKLVWKGNITIPLITNLTRNSTQVSSFIWNGSTITFDLNALDPGVHNFTLQLRRNSSSLAHEENFMVRVYPTESPVINSIMGNQFLIWDEPCNLTWNLFDYSPASWSLLINDTMQDSGIWETNSYELQLTVNKLEEGHHNVTLIVYDQIGNWASWTTGVTVVPPSPPIFTSVPAQFEFLWGQENVVLSWEIHGGANWVLWKNGTLITEGRLNNTQLDIRLDDKEGVTWSPGIYNVTLQIIEKDGTAIIHTSWIQITTGDAFADSLVNEVSRWYWDGENVLGPPDGEYTLLYFDYGNGHVTMDMGLGEEILNRKGTDFKVYAQGDEYTVFVSNNLSVPLLIGSQISAPLTLLGTGVGNKSFDLQDVNFTEARYVQIAYSAGEVVEIDAIEAIYYNQPQSPTNYGRWILPIVSTILIIATVGVIWVRSKKNKF